MQASFDHFSNELKKTQNISGAFIECGVYQGETFVPLARAAAQNGRTVWGVDSFVGMLAPHPIHDRDANGQVQYGEGCFHAGGDGMVKSIQNQTAVFGNRVEIIAGFIPGVLEKIPTETRFAFAHVDLDQYVPTMHALMWLWPRMNGGGIIALHDWFPEYNCLASLAIKNFCKDHNMTQPEHSNVRYAFLTRS